MSLIIDWSKYTEHTTPPGLEPGIRIPKTLVLPITPRGNSIFSKTTVTTRIIFLTYRNPAIRNMEHGTDHIQ